MKGQYNGECNRTACKEPNATWHNRVMQAYYCRRCAKDINKHCAKDEAPMCKEVIR